jgi:hypothetical protein
MNPLLSEQFLFQTTAAGVGIATGYHGRLEDHASLSH